MAMPLQAGNQSRGGTVCDTGPGHRHVEPPDHWPALDLGRLVVHRQQEFRARIQQLADRRLLAALGAAVVAGDLYSSGPKLRIGSMIWSLKS
jgi:hypothetical protein